MIRVLIAGLLCWLACLPAQATTIRGGVLGKPSLESMSILLQDSPLWGAGGSVFDHTTRVAIPNEIGLPPAEVTTTWTQDETLRASSCSTDETTMNALIARRDAASEKTLIWLPDNCEVKLFVQPSEARATAFEFLDSKDEIGIACATASCGVELNFYPGGGPGEFVYDWAGGNAYTDDDTIVASYAIAVGSTQSAPLQSCDWTATDAALGTKMLQLNPADCQIALSGANAWGPGDLIRLETNRIPGAGSASKSHAVYQVQCVKSYGTAAANDGTLDGTGCTSITGDNQLQITDTLHFDYRPAAYYWGVHDGETFADYGGGTGTYDLTTGHQVHQIERVGDARGGNGTETNQVAEGIVLWKINFTIAEGLEYVGGRYLGILDAFNTHVYRPTMDGRIGGMELIGIGGTGVPSGVGEGTNTSIHSPVIYGGAYKGRCFGEILAIRANNPVEVDIYSPGTCSFSSGDPQIGFTGDVADSRLAGKTFVKVQGSLVGSTRTVTLTGLNGANPDGTGTPIDTTPGGLAINLDQYDNAWLYHQGRAFNTQLVNARLWDTMQGPMIQSGGGRFVMAYSRKRIHPEWNRGRGPMWHGNAGGAGHIFVGNDWDQWWVPSDTSNRAPTDHGEGTNVLIAKNRWVSVASTWPLGTLAESSGNYSNPGIAFWMNPEDQWGFSNEKWSYLLNAAPTLMVGSTLIDNSDNLPDTAGGDVAPHLFYDLSWHRNRSNGTDNDDNFDTNNTLVTKDVGAGENDESGTVPTAYQDERAGSFDSIWPKPAWWDCTGGSGGSSSMPFLQIGANWDDLTNPSANGKLPAQILEEGGSCPGLP